MAINLKTLYDNYYGDTAQLTPVKDNTPFGYYDNDPEFTTDALNVTKFIAQRLGVTGPSWNGVQLSASPGNLSITDLSVYAAFEEAVTTYGNTVYQYKIRDQYINMEGSETLPFFTTTKTYVNSDDVNSPVTWSEARLATWAEIGYDPAFSQSIVDNEVWCISSSLSDYIAPDFNFIKSFTLADKFYSEFYGTYLNLSEYVLNRFNKTGGPTTFVPYYNPNSGSFNFSTVADNTTYGITGSNNVKVNLILTSSATQIDTATTLYVVTGSTTGITAYNIGNKKIGRAHV